MLAAQGGFARGETDTLKTEQNARCTTISQTRVIKLLRAYGGCLGAKSRRRAWLTAKSLGEPSAGEDPGISEWGNPARDSLVTVY